MNPRRGVGVGMAIEWVGDGNGGWRWCGSGINQISAAPLIPIFSGVITQ